MAAIVAAESIDARVAESEQAGWRFMRRLAEEWASGANRFDGAGEVFFAALIGGARANAEAEGVTARRVRGDMRELPFDDEFHAVINIFTALGYFEDPEADVQTLRGVWKAVPTAPAWLQRAGLGADVIGTGAKQRGSGAEHSQGRHPDADTSLNGRNTWLEGAATQQRQRRRK